MPPPVHCPGKLTRHGHGREVAEQGRGTCWGPGEAVSPHTGCVPGPGTAGRPRCCPGCRGTQGGPAGGSRPRTWSQDNPSWSVALPTTVSVGGRKLGGLCPSAGPQKGAWLWRAEPPKGLASPAPASPQGEIKAASAKHQQPKGVTDTRRQEL